MGALFLRTADSNHRSYRGFQWPKEVGAVVEAPDWNPEPHCGHGLHGLLWGEGDAGLLSSEASAVWQVVESDEAEAVPLGGKYKFRSCSIRYIGDRDGAVSFIQENGGYGRAVAFGTATAGYEGTATAGYEGTATAGYRGTATAGYRGTATAGDEGTATAGDRGTATAGYRGTATAGDRGTILIAYYSDNRRRMKVGYIGEGGLKPNTPYRLDEDNEFVAVGPNEAAREEAA